MSSATLVATTRASAPRTGRRSRRRGIHHAQQLLASVLFAPSLLVVAVVVYGFIGFTLRVSVAKDYSPLNPSLTATPNLLANYAELMSMQRFQASLRNIVIFTVLLLIVATIAGLVLAELVHHTVRAAGFFRSVFLLPYALSFIVTGVVWRWIFTPGTGANLLLKYSGISGLFESITGHPLQPGWITDPAVAGSLNGVIGAVSPGAANFLQIQLGIPLALVPVVIAAAWQLSGFAMAMFLAGLGTIPEEVLEAAKMDGAGPWREFWHITLPLLRPSMVVSLVLMCYTALKSFDLFYSMVGKGPGFATDVPGLFVYDQMFRGLNYNIGSAASIVMLILVCAVVIPYLARTFAREERG